MNIVPYKAEHLLKFRLQPAQLYLAAWTTEDHAHAVEMAVETNMGWAFTGVDDDGKILGCAGVNLMWPGRGLAWSYLSREVGRYFPKVHRAVLRFMNGCPVHRIEATVDAGFAEGHRWVTMLGFVQETPKPMRGYRPDGGDCYLYARVR